MKPGIVRPLDSRNIEKLEHKLRALEKIIATNQLGDFPTRASIANFARWENTEPGVVPLPRTWIYHPSCLSQQRRLVHLLDQLKRLRTERTKKGNKESNLRWQFKKAEERAQDYVNQYSETRAKLIKANAEINRLHQRLQRCLSQASKITPLRLVTRKGRKIDKPPRKK